MKVFLTGATGLIGSFVLRELIRHGHTPVILVRKASNVSLIHHDLSQCEIIEGDILDILSIKEGMKECESVIHCAGKVSFDPKKEKEIYQVNVEGTVNIVNACLQVGIQKLIHVSSIAALGRENNKIDLNESSQWTESSLNSTYATSKYLAELEIFRGGEEGLDFSIVNPSIVLGPGDSHRSSTRLFSQIRRVPYLHPKGFLNVVDVRDVARTICALLRIHHKDRLILNAGELSYKDFYGLVKQKLGIGGPLIPISKTVLHILAILESIKSLLLGKEPLVTSENLRFMHKNFCYNSTFYSLIFPDAPLIQMEDSIKWTIENLNHEKL